MRPRDRRRHVLKLVDELRVSFQIREELQETLCATKGSSCGEAYIDGTGGWVVVSHEPGASVEAYLVALHELGHLAVDGRGPRGWRKNWPTPVLALEARAWRWALIHSREQGPGVWEVIHKHLNGYAEAADADARYRRCASFEELFETARTSY